MVVGAIPENNGPNIMRWVEDLTKVVERKKFRKKEIGIAGAGDRPCGEWRQLRLRLRFVSSSDEKRLSLASSLARLHLLQQNQLKPLRGFAFLWT